MGFYRGFDIRALDGEPGFGVYRPNGTLCYAKVNTAWSGKVWVDEFLAQ